MAPFTKPYLFGFFIIVFRAVPLGVNSQSNNGTVCDETMHFPCGALA